MKMMSGANWQLTNCSLALQTIYDSYFISFYNVFFTSVPCMMMAFFEQVSEVVSCCIFFTIT